MDEPKKDEEKFLPNPLDTPEILSAQLEKPLLTTEEFIKTTPAHELKNMFGTVPETPEPKIFPQIPTPPTPVEPVAVAKVTPVVEVVKNFSPIVPTQNEKETSAPLMMTTENPKKVKPKLAIGKFLFGLLFVLLILLIGLYVWGGILKEWGVSPLIETSSR